MSTANELIAVIEDARSKGTNVKSIRKQKYDPNRFYMTQTDGRQVGPISVEGNADELNRKYNDAVAFLTAKKPTPAPAKANPSKQRKAA
jgi:hypothetical protein